MKHEEKEIIKLKNGSKIIPINSGKTIRGKRRELKLVIHDFEKCNEDYVKDICSEHENY